MANRLTSPTLAQSIPTVNIGYQLYFQTFPDSMIDHKVPLQSRTIIYKVDGSRVPVPYGLSKARRVLSPQLLLKRFDLVKHFLKHSVRLTTAQCEVTLRLLRLFAYYGQVYPKQALVTEQPGCSQATYWRTMQALKGAGLITVVNRYIMRPHAQISNLYHLDKLLLMIARYLTEHGCPFTQKWLQPYLTMPGSQFWGEIRTMTLETSHLDFGLQSPAPQGPR